MEIRPYKDDDKEQIINLIVNIQQNEFHLNIDQGDQPDLKRIDSFYQKDLGNFWVAVVNKKIVGTIALLDIGNNQTALRKLFVDKNYRGHRCGTASVLLNTVLTWSNERSITDIYLGTVSKFLAAHRFYEKNDFHQVTKIDLPKHFMLVDIDDMFYHRQLAKTKQVNAQQEPINNYEYA